MLSLLVPISLAPIWPKCAPGMTCVTVSPYENSLEFECAYVKPVPQAPKGYVYFAHGNTGMYSKAKWAALQLQMSQLNYMTLACDGRGYSPEASPKDVSAYSYDLMAQDFVALADHVFGKGVRYHQVAHDQGARISWHAIALGLARDRFISLSSLAIPHADAFSSALFGPNPYPLQQTHSQVGSHSTESAPSP
jgi:pimeloyl-ACP methyl ester carboxylesterase